MRAHLIPRLAAGLAVLLAAAALPASAEGKALARTWSGSPAAAIVAALKSEAYRRLALKGDAAWADRGVAR